MEPERTSVKANLTGAGEECQTGDVDWIILVGVPPMTEAGLHSFLSQFRLGVLSTIADSGAPQSALVGVAVTPELELVFDTN